MSRSLPGSTSPPIIFIHYGDSYYLKYTLESAVSFNPDKQVILLGDHENAYHKRLGVIHIDFKDYAAGPEIELFDRVYQHIAGSQHGRHEWTRFVFRRWFNIYNYIKAHGISRFWTFDSDTLILTRLSAYEARFARVDCTEQCSGICMNGFIPSLEVVKGYVDKVNELFQREPFLDEQRANLRELPWYAFTEMRAYVAYRTEAGLKTVRLGAIVDGEAFLDSICTLEEHKIYLDDDEYETYDVRVWRHEIKKVYLRHDGEIFLRHRSTGQFVKLNTINMSWVPEWLFQRLLRHASRKLRSRLGPTALRNSLARLLAWIRGARASGSGERDLKLVELVEDTDDAGVVRVGQRSTRPLVRRLLGFWDER